MEGCRSDRPYECSDPGVGCQVKLREQEKGLIKDELKRQMQRTARLHTVRAERSDLADIEALEYWQKERITSTYADLQEKPRYQAATRFFVDDLYAPSNVVDRDADLERMYPTMIRLLPDGVLTTISKSIELQADTLALDLKMVEAMHELGDDPRDINAITYAKAFRHLQNVEERRHQVELIMAVGRELDHYVHIPLVYATLKMARLPARMAGLSDLQEFLEDGFSAFRSMGNATDFLATIRRRELAILEAIMAGHEDPFGSAVPD